MEQFLVMKAYCFAGIWLFEIFEISGEKLSFFWRQLKHFVKSCLSCVCCYMTVFFFTKVCTYTTVLHDENAPYLEKSLDDTGQNQNSQAYYIGL